MQFIQNVLGIKCGDAYPVWKLHYNRYRLSISIDKCQFWMQVYYIVSALVIRWNTIMWV